jgi:hypothetical protein
MPAQQETPEMPHRPDKRAKARWIRQIQESSSAMDIPPGLFTKAPRQIAQGLKRAVFASRRTKGTKFQSAMSMLTWFINRGGRGLSGPRLRRLERAKEELRRIFKRTRPRRT